ncbi:MAG: phage portal protein [Dermatophilaceae bacterium]|nr:phage portal protein [Intrasporangiaceae bacterium]
MSANFASPAHRAGGSDLAISISPLGLVELSDEEFEVHGPRLNRYATQWAMYLGHHWGYQRESGEPLLTFNYVKAFSDYITNFCFGNGVRFKTPKATEAIVPNLLHRIWEVDNDRQRVLWSMGQLGSVSGDVFVKVAYEEPYVDAAGRPHRGKVRLIPLNPSFCFPEFHPHDRTKIIRFKLKYRFWGTGDDGTRQVNTYTEIMTESTIEEYVNDKMIGEPKPNMLGKVPVVYYPNIPVEGSPWGLSNIGDILGLNREFNEKATELSDIINYHAAPVTVITGAKANQLEKGPKKVWGGLPKDANVFNLDMTSNFSGPLAYMEMLKSGMHEMTGVPHGALGEKQAISNTSGVALAVQFQPLMNRADMIHMQAGWGLEKINELALLTLAVKEPYIFKYNPEKESDLKPGQYPVLDLSDPLTYQTTTDFPPPLPTDILIKLNEIEGKMSLGLESKRGALKELGEEFPDEKMAEVYEELREDIHEQAGLDLLRGHYQTVMAMALGIVPEDESGDDVSSAGGQSVTHASGDGTEQAAPQMTPEMVHLYEQMVTNAFAPRVGARRSQSRNN